MSETLSGSTPAERAGEAGPAPVTTPAAGTTMAAGSASPHRGGDLLYYALHNKKLVFGVSLEALLVLVAILGPIIAPHNMTDYFASNQPPSAQHWLGTDNLGHDLFAEVVSGMRVSYLVGAIGALCAAFVGMALGFTAGWRGGMLDEILQMITNIVVMMPALVLLIVIGAYLKTRGITFEGTFIGLITWPWVARAVRAQTFTLKSREFVDLARLSGKRGFSIVVREIAPNMASYLFLVVVLLFGSSMLLAANFDFLGLGPTTGTSLGNIMNQSTLWSALQLHYWWWFLPPGLLLTGMVAALLIANVGLDEVFNPKLREQ